MSSVVPAGRRDPTDARVRAATIAVEEKEQSAVHTRSGCVSAGRRRTRNTWRACVATRSGPVVEQLQGRLDGAGQEMVGEVPIGERSRELQGADHHAEDR